MTENSTPKPDVATLATENRGLVYHVAKRYNRAQDPDAISAGVLGLCEAADRYTETHGAFASYACAYIRLHIVTHIKGTRAVNVAGTRAGRRIFQGIGKARRECAAQGIEPSHANLAAILGIAEDKVRDLAPVIEGKDKSLHAPIATDDGDGDALIDHIPDPNATDPGETIDRETRQARLAALIAEFTRACSDRERTILANYMSDEPRTFPEIGAEWGVSKQRAEQVAARVKARLREYLAAHL